MCSYIRVIFICCVLYLLLFKQNRVANLLSKSSSMGLELSSSHDPLLLMKLLQFLKAGCLTLQSNRFTLYLFGSQSCCSEVMRQGLYPPWDRVSGWSLSFWEETDLEAEPTWPSWPGNDSKLWSFFTASCRDKHKWLSSYCFDRSNTSFVNVYKIICSTAQSGSRVVRVHCSLCACMLHIPTTCNFLMNSRSLRAFNDNFNVLRTYEWVQLFVSYL